MTRTRFLLTCGSAALVLATVPANADSIQAGTDQTVALASPQVSVVDSTHTVVTFEASGDIRGMLTLTLFQGSAGQPVTGDWAFVSRYIQDMVGPDDGPPARTRARGEEPQHEEHIEFVERGTIRGPVTDGVLGFDADGRLDSIDSLRLEVAGGYLEFAGATGGGTGGASNLQDVKHGSGTLVLALEVRR